VLSDKLTYFITFRYEAAFCKMVDILCLDVDERSLTFIQLTRV